MAGDVVSPVPDVPSPGARNKHNGQPVAEPGEGAEGISREGHDPALARGGLERRRRVVEPIALWWYGARANGLVFSLPFAYVYPPATEVFLHAATSGTAVLSSVTAAGPFAYGPTQVTPRLGEVGGGSATGYRTRPPGANFAGVGEGAAGGSCGGAAVGEDRGRGVHPICGLHALPRVPGLDCAPDGSV